MTSLRVQLFGGVRVEREGAPVANLTRTLQGLVAFLALNHHRTHPRDILYTHFWGDQPEDRARRCLNTAIWRLRQVLEPAGTARGSVLVTTAAGEVGLAWPPGARLDVDEFEHAALRLAEAVGGALMADELELLDRAIAGPRGELLEGWYDSWALEARERLRVLLLRALGDLTAAHRRAGDYRSALTTADRALALDPLREEVVRELMHAALASGDRATALQRYRDLRRRLRSDLGIDPLPETQALFRDMTRAAGPDPVSRRDPGPTPSPIRRTLHDLDRIRRRLAAAIRDLEASLPDLPTDR